jgi:hypothetical protein
MNPNPNPKIRRPRSPTRKPCRPSAYTNRTKNNTNSTIYPDNTKPIPKNDTNQYPNPQNQATKITSTKALQAECLERELCLLVMKGQKYSSKEEKVLGGA